MKVFLDTGAWIALEVKNDFNHSEALDDYRSYKKRRSIFYTNACVLSETFTRFIYDVSLEACLTFNDHINDLLKLRELSIIEVDKSRRDLSLQYLTKYSDHKLSFTDATIVSDFREFSLDEIFTFDNHFKEINLPTNLV